MANKYLFVVGVLALFLLATTAQGQCSYTVYIQTGDVKNAGTDARISLTLSGRNGQSMRVDNIEDWGQMGFHHDYFEKGQLDRFAGNAACVSGSLCGMTIISDGSGNKPGWYLQSVMVSVNGGPTSTFNVREWIQPGHWSTTKTIC